MQAASWDEGWPLLVLVLVLLVTRCGKAMAAMMRLLAVRAEG
jgi:hypothetical protein